jgi:hypothetical protein
MGCNPAMPMQGREKKREPVLLQSNGYPSGGATAALICKRLYLHQQGPAPLMNGRHHTSRHRITALGNKQS